MKKIVESLIMPKKLKEAPFGFFQHPFCRKTPREGRDSLGKIFFPKKNLAMREKLKGNPLVSSGIVCYAGNRFGSVPWANGYNLASS